MKTETAKTKHHGSLRRPNRLELSFTDAEFRTLSDLADEAGAKKLAAFARKLILGGSVIEAAVTADDRRDISQLSKIGSNLWELRKRLIMQGLDNHFVADLDSFYKEFAAILKYYRTKLEK